MFSQIIKKFYKLIIPTFFFMLLGVVMYLFIETNYSFKEVLKLFLFWDGLCPFNSPCWFFIVLFEVFLLSYIFRINTFTFSELFLFNILIYMFGFFLIYTNIFIPFGFNRAVVAFGFFLTGLLFKRIYDYSKSYKYTKIILIIISIISLPIWIYFGYYSFIFCKYIYFVISGIFGTIFFSFISYLVSKIKYSSILISISKASIFLIGTHFVLDYYFKKVASHFDIGYTYKYLFISFIFAIGVVLLYIPICNFIDKKVPVLNGKRRNI